MISPGPEGRAPDEPRTLTVFTGSGLSNRLRVLVSGLALAEATGRALTMLWPRSPACGAAFRELFTNDWPVVDIDKIPRELAGAHRRKPRGRHKIGDLLEAPEPHLVVRSSHWLIASASYPAHRALAARCVELLGQLEPTSPIRDRVAAFRAQHFRPLMIGVHARRGDFLEARPDRAWNTGQILAAVDRFLVERPEAGILLCTDDGAPGPRGEPTVREGVREILRARYGDRLVETSPSSLDRRTPASIQDALVDLLLLRATDAFVGTLSSTFSDLATYGRAVPSARVWGMSPASRWLYRIARFTGIRLGARVLRQVLGVDVHGPTVARYVQAELPSRLRWWRRDRRRPRSPD